MDLNLNDYIDICETYNITKNSYNNYLVESEASDNGSYEAYLAKCKNKGKVPMSKAAYLNKKRKLKIGIGLAAGAAAATGAGIAAKKGLDNSVKYQAWRRERTALNKQAHEIKQQSDAERRENVMQERANRAQDRVNQKLLRHDEKNASRTGFFNRLIHGSNASAKRISRAAGTAVDEELEFFIDICYNYNITEQCMEMYNYHDTILTEDQQDELYQDYVNKCKSKNKIPLSKAGWLNRKDKIKKGLLIGGSILGAGAAAAIGGKVIYNNTRAGRKAISFKQKQQQDRLDWKKQQIEDKEKHYQEKEIKKQKKQDQKRIDRENKEKKIQSIINNSTSTGDYYKPKKRRKK